MPMTKVRTGVSALGLFMVLGAVPASAGGSGWETIPDRVTVGDEVTVWAAVAWGHNDSLGSPDDGPFHAYLREVDGTDDDWAYGFVPDDAMWIAEIDVVLGPYDNGEWRVGPNHAIFEFIVPDLAPGEYSIVHCNDPCTTSLGDITWGRLLVADEEGNEPPFPTTIDVTTTSTSTSTSTSTAITTITTLTSTTVAVSSVGGAQAVPLADDGSSDDRPSAIAGGAAGLSLLAGAGLAGWKIRRRRS